MCSTLTKCLELLPDNSTGEDSRISLLSVVKRGSNQLVGMHIKETYE